MPVEDKPVHHLVRKQHHEAGCHSARIQHSAYRIVPMDYRTFTGEIVPSYSSTAPCRQVGRKFNDVWVPLDECMGCDNPKDFDYINKSRQDIDNEFK